MKLFEHQIDGLDCPASVKGFEGLYEVDESGNVYSLLKDRKLLHPTKHNGKQPYYYVTLRKDGKSHKRFVHRLVAEAFLPNPNNLPQVNHMDGNPHNNSVNNLEWINNRDNTKHAYAHCLRKKRVIWLFDGESYHTLRSICEELNLDYKKVHCRIRYLNWNLDKAMDYKGGGRYVMCETLPSSVECS